MIARGCEGISQFAEDAFGIVMNGAGLAVKQLWCANDLAAESCADCLMAQADAEYGEFSREALDQVDADSRVLGRARTGGNYDAFWFAAGDLFHGNFVVAMHFDIAAQFAEVLSEVVGEGIVVVE